MVGEFPELQGIMGRYYARHDGEAAAVADAIGEHYAPKGPGDTCPTAPVSVAVALADKLDTLVGFFGIGEKPYGSGDPYALRRAALGIIRLIVENRLRVSLGPVLAEAAAPYAVRVADFAGGDPAALGEELLTFIANRLKVHLKGEGVRHDLIAAAFAEGGEDDLVRLLARVDALRDFLGTDDGANLLTAFKRASNIVRIEESKDEVSYDGLVEETFLSQAEETRLYHALVTARTEIEEHVRDEAFGAAMTVVARLRAPVDAFFDHVTVNCEDADTRANRLRLLSQIRSALQGVADFSQIEG
jgi:glycyl-tRNA synthetase beta chain